MPLTLWTAPSSSCKEHGQEPSSTDASRHHSLDSVIKGLDKFIKAAAFSSDVQSKLMALVQQQSGSNEDVTKFSISINSDGTLAFHSHNWPDLKFARRPMQWRPLPLVSMKVESHSSWT